MDHAEGDEARQGEGVVMVVVVDHGQLSMAKRWSITMAETPLIQHHHLHHST
jgi:hypothetical protein